jgi:polysaccharide biosynthesis transport protein
MIWSLHPSLRSLGLALGVGYLVLTPPVYTAATRILIDEQLTRFTQDEPRASAGSQIDSMIQSEVEILGSTRLARAVADAESLYENEVFLDPPRGPVAWLRSRVRTMMNMLAPSRASQGQTAETGEPAGMGEAVALLRQGMSAERVGRSFVIELSYQNSDPQLAGAITRAYAEAYLSDQLEANFEATQNAMSWLQGRLEELQRDSQQAALEVERFRAEHGLTATRGELLSEQQLSDLNHQLVLAQAETTNARARYERFRAILESGPENAVRNAPIPPDQPNSAIINEQKSRYMAIASRLEDIEERFGEDHQQAESLRREQRDLERQIFRELEQLLEAYHNEYVVAQALEESLGDNV